MNWMSKLMDKNSEAVVMKLLQQGITNSPEKKKENWGKKIEAMIQNQMEIIKLRTMIMKIKKNCWMGWVEWYGRHNQWTSGWINKYLIRISEKKNPPKVVNTFSGTVGQQ